LAGEENAGWLWEGMKLGTVYKIKKKMIHIQKDA